MTRESSNPRTDKHAPDSNAPVSRRKFLGSTALAPLGIAAPSLSLVDGRTEQLASPTPLVKAPDLPADFESYDNDTPSSFARYLIARDDQFERDHFASGGFTEGPDQSNPRYVVSTISIRLPDPSSRATVRESVVELFDQYMERLYGSPGAEWTRIETLDQDDSDVHLHATVDFAPLALSHIDWIESGTSTQFSEHWTIDATERQAVMTIVFGPEKGRWHPQSLLTTTRAHLNRRLHK